MSEETLKPCPFCGAIPMFVEERAKWGTSPGNLRISCSRCFCRTWEKDTETWESGRGAIYIYEQVRLDLIKLWNTREELELSRAYAEIDRLKLLVSQLQGDLKIIPVDESTEWVECK